MKFGRILAPVDFSAVTQRVVEAAALLARAFQGKLWLLHVADPDPDFVGWDAGPEVVRDQVAHALREEHRRLQAEAQALREQGLDATALLVQGPTVETILAEARRLEADLVVVGSHGHGAVHRMLVGSVSEGVLRGARCPLLVISARGDQS